MKKITIIQVLIVPFLIIFEILFHEFGHALMLMMNEIHHFSLQLYFPIKVTLYHYGENVQGINQIIVSIMGPVFGTFYSLIGWMISKRFKLNMFEVGFQVILLSELIAFVIPATDFIHIQQVNSLFALILWIISIPLSILVTIFLMKNIYKTIDDYYNQKIILSEELTKFYEEIDRRNEDALKIL